MTETLSNQGSPIPAPNHETLAQPPAPAPAPAAPADQAAPPVNPNEAPQPQPNPQEAPTEGQSLAPAVVSLDGVTPIENTPLAATQEGETFAYDETGDPGMDIALGFIGRLGIAPDDPAMVKAGEGDFSFLRAKLAALGDKAQGWEQMLALGETAYKNAVAQIEKNQAAAQAAVHKAVGGEERWREVQAWAKSNATDSERAEINAMLSASPIQARAAALLLNSLYDASGNATVQPRSAAAPTASAAAPANGHAPLTRQEYLSEVNALIAREGIGAVNNNSAAYRSLQARHAAYLRNN